MGMDGTNASMRPHSVIDLRPRRMERTILSAAHAACDAQRLGLARALLHDYEELITAGRTRRPPPGELAKLVAGHERLWAMRHPDNADGAGPRPAAH